MTGGVAVVLGSIGANFGAGMTGGLAYLYDPGGVVAPMLNMETLVAVPVNDGPYIAELEDLLHRHVKETGSARATQILQHWDEAKANFVQI